MTKETALILGANGRFGRHAAKAFENAGWTVRRFNRATDDLTDAAMGAAVVVNGWNPPDYGHWAEQLPGQTDAVITAAKRAGATIMLAGNVYVYGSEAPATLGVGTPYAATNPLGRLRIDMEARYRASGVQTIVLRAGDFIDTEASGNWLDKVIAAKVYKGRLAYPGRTDVPHAWAYLPDMARALVALAEMRNELAVFEDVPFPGYTLTGEQLGQAIGRALDTPISAKRMSWLPIQLVRPFWPLAKFLLEMRYLWDKPHSLSSNRFDVLLPDFVATPADRALATALSWQNGT